MGKNCVVKGCPSGRKIKNSNNDTALSYFRPTTPARLIKWQRSLDMVLKANDTICHLHFKEEHVKMYEKFIINGEIKMFPVRKKKLKDGALPTIEHQFIPMPEHELKAYLIPESQITNSYDNHSENNKQYNVESISIKQEKLLESDTISLDDHIIEIKMEDPLLNNQLHDDFDTDNETVSPVKSFRDTFLKYPMLPPYWLYTENPEGLELMKMDPSTNQMKHHIRLNEDATVTVIFANNEELPLNMRLNSFNNTYQFLRYVEKWPLCVGTQIGSNKYSKLCRNVLVGDDAYQRKQKNPRCRSCRTLRKRLQSQNIPLDDY